ncbi:type VII secretion-associated serine protease mycosin [Kitasatospora sp. MMS16-BH015]|uniref:type VII secretion-associated serine protease mycosin n=1 Tax=Kitasatospora sp. MMS16-BH015 TaxID=2018025 RepID=UPI0020C38BD8|nr:type VII secretion-associated serine protease mycosin [Kitasatospora sp. MMS16-BH015]
MALGVVGGLAAGPAYADDSAKSTARWTPLVVSAAAECAVPSLDVQGVPWSLQRVLLNQLWLPDTSLPVNERKPIDGTNVKVAVIDTGVDNANPQLAGAGKVIDGGAYIKKDGKEDNGSGIGDPVGHGTKVAGIIAASPFAQTGFVGLAPGAQIIAIRQNDAEGNGDVPHLVQAINRAVALGAGVINISQDVRGTDSSGKLFDGKDDLEYALKKAEAAGVVVVASSGNDGLEGETYPAAFSTVLAVGASDRNNERASFSQYGSFVGVAAPGVDMLSTARVHGQCVDNGTSFSSPYVAGVAALLKQKYPKWTPRQIRTRIEQTAERNGRDRNDYTGWGVVDPVKAVQSTAEPADEPTPDAAVQIDSARIVAMPLGLAETQQDRDRRTALYVVAVGLLTVAGLGGGSVVLRDRRKTRSGEGG